MRCQGRSYAPMTPPASSLLVNLSGAMATSFLYCMSGEMTAGFILFNEKLKVTLGVLSTTSFKFV